MVWDRVPIFLNPLAIVSSQLNQTQFQLDPISTFPHQQAILTPAGCQLNPDTNYVERESDFTGKELSPRISLVVQWLRLHVPNAGGQGSISG